MDAGDAGHALGDGLADRRDRLSHPLGPVGDEGRQERRRAVPGMRLRHQGERSGIGPLVEQDAASAIDLSIDEARREKAAGKLDPTGVGGDLEVGHDGEDPRAVHQHAMALEDALAREDAGAGQRKAGHHTVSVTLRSRLGRSGSCPRARATSSARP